MAADQKTEMECWVVNEASDLATAIDAATELTSILMFLGDSALPHNLVGQRLPYPLASAGDLSS